MYMHISEYIYIHMHILHISSLLRFLHWDALRSPRRRWFSNWEVKLRQSPWAKTVRGSPWFHHKNIQKQWFDRKNMGVEPG